MEITYKAKVEIPSLPNFIRTVDGHAAIAVSSFSAKELEEIGKEWTKALIKKGKKNK